MKHPIRSRWSPLAGWAAAFAALGAVFALYTRPAFMVTLIDQLWACF